MSHQKLEPYKDTPIKRPAEAYDDLRAGIGYYVVLSDCQKVVIKEVALAYWIDAIYEKQEYVAPVFEFKGERLNEAGAYLEDFTGWVQAVK